MTEKFKVGDIIRWTNSNGGQYEVTAVSENGFLSLKKPGVDYYYSGTHNPEGWMLDQPANPYTDPDWV